MSLKAIRRVVLTGSTTLDAVVRLVTQLQDALAEFLQPLANNPRLDSVTLTSKLLTGGVDTTIDHKLGRTPQGWDITDAVGADSTFRRVSWTSTTIVLRASGTCTANVEVW